ncbi:uncharacterized protein LOC111778294 isoform X1 [Cucurbita pepo subsp. pepo]|uniref:uncharacterized protein LOC111778294 isoform X1 n=1 Tax=Cucurbita pepo subsp. pepo TaxID=3664 RepID=UPI000C9D6E79|nr:uncharacterized protein LOC111778294 isoform X1 [Cucurbita pepo subsp. pepo]
MGVLGDSLCFCKGVGKSERTKAAIFSGKAPAMVRISAASSSSSSSSSNGASSGTAFLIHRSLLLTTHVNLPSVSAAESCEIRLQNGGAATLVPHRFFITSSILDLTIVGLDAVEGDSHSQQQLQHLKICSKPNLDLGNAVYLLGFSDKDELIISEGKVAIATDNLIKLSTDGVTCSPGSAGFDAQGNLAFMVCDPMKLATSPNTKSSSTSSSSSSSCKKDLPMQFGIPLPIICGWLNQHWEGSLEELNKPKPQLIRLMSSGQKSEHSSSFTLRQVFKPMEANDEETREELPGPSYSTTTNTIKEEAPMNNLHLNHVQGIPTPEIYESPKLIAVPLRKKESAPMQLRDINFPPRVSMAVITGHPTRQNPLGSNENSTKDVSQHNQWRQYQSMERQLVDPIENREEVASTNSVNGALSEVQSCSSPEEVSAMHNGYSSEGETTMYSAETAESRNYTSPREGKFQQVGRSQSCVNYNRWGSVQRNPMARQTILENQRSFRNGRKMYSQGAGSYRSNDYYSPTVSSIMKKRNSSEQVSKPRQSTAAAHSSPRWMF